MRRKRAMMLEVKIIFTFGNLLVRAKWIVTG
jgi:hypothetical protein